MLKTSMRAAAIDIGSNSLLLTIAELGPNKIPLRLLFDEAYVTGLSKGLAHGSIITDESFEKSAKIFEYFYQKILELKPDKVAVMATEALRRASNGSEIKSRIEKILRHPVELIPGVREAELSFWSVQKEHPQREAKKLVFDIGGASTELCFGSASGIQERISLKVGSVVLTETFQLQNQCDPCKAIDHVRGLIRSIPWISDASEAVGIGVAGTITSVAAIQIGLSKYQRDKVHGLSISRENLSEILSKVVSRSTEKRAEIIGLSRDRADVFSGGLSIVSAIMQEMAWQEFVCMDSGVRFGALYELFEV